MHPLQSSIYYKKPGLISSACLKDASGLGCNEGGVGSFGVLASQGAEDEDKDDNDSDDLFASSPNYWKILHGK